MSSPFSILCPSPLFDGLDCNGLGTMLHLDPNSVLAALSPKQAAVIPTTIWDTVRERLTRTEGKELSEREIDWLSTDMLQDTPSDELQNLDPSETDVFILGLTGLTCLRTVLGESAVSCLMQEHFPPLTAAMAFHFRRRSRKRNFPSDRTYSIPSLKKSALFLSIARLKPNKKKHALFAAF
jgi:hypothetical protein